MNYGGRPARGAGVTTILVLTSIMSKDPYDRSRQWSALSFAERDFVSSKLLSMEPKPKYPELTSIANRRSTDLENHSSFCAPIRAIPADVLTLIFKECGLTVHSRTVRVESEWDARLDPEFDFREDWEKEEDLIHHHATTGNIYKLAQVCTYWRQVIHSTPFLWADLSFGPWTRPRGRAHVVPLNLDLEEVLKLSGNHPLRVKIVAKRSEGETPGYSSELRLIIAESHRWVNLDLTITWEGDTSFRLGNLPQLESVTIRRMPRPSHDIKSILLAPRLHNVELDRIDPRRMALPWKQLRSISAALPSDSSSTDDPRPIFSMTTFILDNATRLERCYLNIRFPDENSNREEVDHAPTMPEKYTRPTTIEYLSIHLMDVLELLDGSAFPNLSVLVIEDEGLEHNAGYILEFLLIPFFPTLPRALHRLSLPGHASNGRWTLSMEILQALLQHAATSSFDVHCWDIEEDFARTTPLSKPERKESEKSEEELVDLLITTLETSLPRMQRAKIEVLRHFSIQIDRLERKLTGEHMSRLQSLDASFGLSVAVKGSSGKRLYTQESKLNRKYMPIRPAICSMLTFDFLAVHTPVN